MIEFFTAVYSCLTFVFACVGIVFVSYQLYQCYLKRRANNAPPNQEFENIRRERLQREEEISIYATDSNLHLHNNTHQVVNRFKEQQAQLGVSITAFDQALEHMQRANSGLDEASRSIQYTIIEPIKALLERIKTQFQQSRALLSTLSDAFTQSTQSLAARERELAAVIQNFSEIEATLRNVQLQADYVTRLNERNNALENGLKSLTEKSIKLMDINKRQERIIDLLQQPQNEGSISHDCRLFGNRTNREISSVDYEEKQDATTAFIAPVSGSAYRDTAITV